MSLTAAQFHQRLLDALTDPRSPILGTDGTVVEVSASVLLGPTLYLLGRLVDELAAARQVPREAIIFELRGDVVVLPPG